MHDNPTAAVVKSECPTCEYAQVHHSWPPGFRGTHCRTCHRSWTSKREAHCTTCHEHFGSNAAADQHWVRGKHTAPADVLGKDDKPRLERRDTPNGATWVQPMDAASLARFARPEVA